MQWDNITCMYWAESWHTSLEWLIVSTSMNDCLVNGHLCCGSFSLSCCLFFFFIHKNLCQKNINPAGQRSHFQMSPQLGALSPPLLSQEEDNGLPSLSHHSGAVWLCTSQDPASALHSSFPTPIALSFSLPLYLSLPLTMLIPFSFGLWHSFCLHCYCYCSSSAHLLSNLPHSLSSHYSYSHLPLSTYLYTLYRDLFTYNAKLPLLLALSIAQFNPIQQAIMACNTHNIANSRDQTGNKIFSSLSVLLVD